MSLLLKGASRQSLAVTRSALEKLISAVDAATAAKISADLFAMVKVLDSSSAVRRALTDYARDESAKSTLGKDIFKGLGSAQALEIFSKMAGLRWSSPRDFGNVLEFLGVQALVASAEKSGSLADLESEIFAVSETIAKSPELRAFFAVRNVVAAPKSELLTSLLSGKVTQATLDLTSYLVDHPRGRNVEAGLNDFAAAIAQIKDRQIAHVVSATALSAEQISRLAKSLTKTFGREIKVNASVKQEVVGGMSIRVADELIDGTLLTRISQADRLLAGKNA
ncbi:F0F1 ATP synthase subunit delta [Actinobacteria bacterium IMCC26103]|nr:F0F1 ATP synthase subunit delta [Actinobacteria bacterium IMCC26103]